MIIGSQIIHIENLPSTNTYATELLREGRAAEGTVIRADYQTSGRGNAGSKWESEEGKNLLISIILFPSFLFPDEQFLISMTIATGICDFLTAFTSGISVKWPNDIYIKDDKIAGILIENSLMGDNITHSVAGIGLNINQKKFPPELPNPVSLTLITAKEHDISGSMRDLIGCLDKRYMSLIEGGNEKIRDDYNALLYRKGIWSWYSDNTGKFEGKLTGVDENGLLYVEKRSGQSQAYTFKEIGFIL
jgi:BirA family transcriptional regulator, biotin operon repressor / biotin---[acetyl-CoA-carboxylase] ligase